MGLHSISDELCRHEFTWRPPGRPVWTASGLDVHGTGRRPVHRFDRAGGKARPGIVSWNCTCLCGDPLCHGDLHWTSLPLVRQNLCQLDSSYQACPSSGIYCGRSRAGRSDLAAVIFLDDQSLRMAHVVLPGSHCNGSPGPVVAVVYPRSSIQASFNRS